jgi:hypothetical protein
MAHKRRPRSWLFWDFDFLGQDTIAELRDQFGPAGPLTILAILSEAKKADLAGLRTPSEQGILSIRAGALAKLVGVSADVVTAVVSRSVDIGLLEWRDGTDLDAGRFVVRSLKRGEWEPKDATAAARSGRARNG